MDKTTTLALVGFIVLIVMTLAVLIYAKWWQDIGQWKN